MRNQVTNADRVYWFLTGLMATSAVIGATVMLSSRLTG